MRNYTFAYKDRLKQPASVTNRRKFHSYLKSQQFTKQTQIQPFVPQQPNKVLISRLNMFETIQREEQRLSLTAKFRTLDARNNRQSEYGLTNMSWRLKTERKDKSIQCKSGSTKKVIYVRQKPKRLLQKTDRSSVVNELNITQKTLGSRPTTAKQVFHTSILKKHQPVIIHRNTSSNSNYQSLKQSIKISPW